MTENNEEIQLTDGQTENLPETQTVITDNRLTDLQPGCGEMTTSPDEQYYTQGEFEAAFNEFLEFLKSPQTSLDTFESLRAQGQSLAAGKIYGMAEKYSFLRWMIDRRTAIVHDLTLIGIFCACETNAIVQNWTGISLAEKGKLWLRNKIKQRAERQQAAGKRNGWGFLGRRGAEKQPKPENSPQA